jgi:hypothetical protein
MPIDYKNGKIYRIVCPDGQYYIGSTTSPLEDRLRQHKMHSKQNPARKLFKTIHTFGWDTVEMELVEAYSCSSKQELTSREDSFIKQAKNDPMCLNQIRACVSKEEKAETMKAYYEAHKEEIKEKHKEYYANPEIKEKVDDYQAKYRKENAEKRRAYSKKYAEENQESVSAARKRYYQENKEELLEKIKTYVEKNKEKVRERKRNWVVRKKEENAETIQKEKEERMALKQKQVEERKLQQETPVECECGGSYQPYRKSRHDKSKKHIAFLQSSSL